LGVLFLALAVEELIGLHEDSLGHFTSRFDLPTYLKFAWVIPASVIVVFLTIYFAKWVFGQPAQVRKNLCLSAGLFLSGAMGMEMLGSHYFHSGEALSYKYALIIGLEESLEMAGAAWMLRTVGQFLLLTADSPMIRLSA
jgi:hypothetical protein